MEDYQGNLLQKKYVAPKEVKVGRKPIVEKRKHIVQKEFIVWKREPITLNAGEET